MSALDGLQFSGSLAPCQAQLEELSAKLQQDRMWVMSWVLGLWSGEEQARSDFVAVLHPFRVAFYGSVDSGKMNVNSFMLACAALRLHTGYYDVLCPRF